MQWWCTSTTEPWTWSYTAYPGIWLAMATLVGGYAWRWRRLRPEVLSVEERWRAASFGAAVAVLWVMTDWPVGALASGYLASLHMTQFVAYTLVVAPLLLVGIPPWMVPHLADRRWAQVATRPWVAGIAYNVVLIGTHTPVVTDTLRASSIGSMVMDAIWLAGGLLLWGPLASPAHELRRRSYAVRCVYLFLAAAALPMLPGAFLVFAQCPLYETFELAPRIGDISATGDQQAAGLIMKVGGMPIIWGVMAGLFVRWVTSERDDDAARAEVLDLDLDLDGVAPAAPSAGGIGGAP